MSSYTTQNSEQIIYLLIFKRLYGMKIADALLHKLIGNSTQTTVTKMTIERMLENKIINLTFRTLYVSTYIFGSDRLEYRCQLNLNLR